MRSNVLLFIHRKPPSFISAIDRIQRWIGQRIVAGSLFCLKPSVSSLDTMGWALGEIYESFVLPGASESMQRIASLTFPMSGPKAFIVF